MRTSVTLHNSDTDEANLGVFTQGVVIEAAIGQPAVLKDVASSRIIARQGSLGWRPEREYGHKRYRRVFIQAVNTR